MQGSPVQCCAAPTGVWGAGQQEQASRHIADMRKAIKAQKPSLSQHIPKNSQCVRVRVHVCVRVCVSASLCVRVRVPVSRIPPFCKFVRWPLHAFAGPAPRQCAEHDHSLGLPGLIQGLIQLLHMRMHSPAHSILHQCTRTSAVTHSQLYILSCTCTLTPAHSLLHTQCDPKGPH